MEYGGVNAKNHPKNFPSSTRMIPVAVLWEKDY